MTRLATALATATATALAAAVLLGSRPTIVHAQSAPRRLAGLFALDGWLASRYRELQLLPDTSKSTRSIAADAPLPHVESVADVAIGAVVSPGSLYRDTLYAVHFGTRRDMPALRVGTRVRLTAPSGAIANTTSDIVARRPFRAPRRPGTAAAASDNAWRYGWAYLALVPRGTRATSSMMYRGWLLLDASSAAPRR